MKKITLIALMLFTALGYAQVGINTNNPDASSVLEIESTTGGILIPRLTETQRDDISAPATGLMIYQTDQTAGFYFYDGNIWTKIDGVAGPQGEAGADGAPGLPGADGTDGVDGAPGLPGADGTDGVDGAPGLPGADGTDGVDGPTGKMGYDGNSSLWLSNGDDMNGGPVSSGSSGYFRIAFATAPWGTDTTTHALTISVVTSQPNPTNYNAWFQFIDPYDVLTIRDDTQPDNVMHFQVLPLSPTNGQPPNGTNGPYIGAYQSGTMFNLRLKLINSAPIGTGLIDGGPFPLNIPCYVGYVKTGATGPPGTDGATGAAGIKTFINTSDEAAGDNCANGGVKIEVGEDANADGILDTDEIDDSLTSYVCEGIDGAGGTNGVAGADGNSSRWKYSEFSNGPFMGAGYFTTGTGFFGLSVNQQTEKDQVNAIRINKTDDNTVTPNLTDWLLFCDIGSLIYIRKVNQVDEVAYYSVTARVDSFNGAQEVKYIVNYVDGDDSPGTFADDEEYYIGFINTSTNSPANAVRFLGIGIADTAPPSTETNPGKFSLTVPSVNTSPIPSWNDANGIVISGEDINNTPIQKWIQGIRENDIVTISQRGNPTNFSHYKMTGTFSELPVNTGVWAGGFQSQGINQYSIAYDSQGIATPYDGSTPPEIPSGWIIEKHPNHVYIDPATGPVIDTGYNSSYTINYEYEISYSNAGIDGAGGADGTDGVDGAPGLPGADGTDGIDGAPGLPGPQGPPGATGPIGPIGERGFDGNSSVWQYNATPTSGQFRLFGVPANIQLAVSQSDAYGDDLDNWLVFAEPGDIITIRDKNDPNNVGYFQLTQPFAMGIGPPPVIFTTQNLIYIDSTPTIDFVSVFPATLFTLIDDCYIGYVKTGTDGPAGSAGPQGPDGDCGLDGNSSVWKLDNAATGGEFDTSSAPTTFNLINQIKINYFDAFGVDMENWILDAQPGDHVTIRERCVFSNYGIYELTSSTVGPGQQSWILNFISGSALSITLNTEYIIGYTQIGPTGPVGPRGPDGTDGIDGVDGLAGAPGLPGAAGADGIDGAQGPIGLTGSDGIDGIDGATGPSGANGANGSAGVQGAQGEAGSQGIQGIQGDIGLTGATGPSGANGANGAQGPQGEPASVMDQGYVNGVNCSIPGATAYNSDVGDNVVCKPYLIIDGTEQFLITNELTCADNSEGTSTNIEYWISFEVSQPLITYLLTFEPFANNSFCGNVSNDFKEIYKVESSLFNSGTNLGEMIFSGSAIPKFVLNPGNTYTIRVAGFDNQVSRTTSISNYSVNSNLFSNVKFYTTTPNSFVLNETFDQWALLYNFGNSFLDGNILTVFSNWELRWQEF